MKKMNTTKNYYWNQNIYYKKKTNTNNNMKGGMSYRIEDFFCMEWYLQQFMDKSIKQWNGVNKP